MNYYKIIKDSSFIGIITSGDMRNFQAKHKILLICNEEKAQYAQWNNTLYHDKWMLPINTDLFQYEDAEIIRIEEQEYDVLLEAIVSGSDIVEEEIELQNEEPIMLSSYNPIFEPTIEFVKDSKINEMSRACRTTIESGIDVELSDGNMYHFSLTTQDQINLISLSDMVSNGATAIPYHADNELCKFYSLDDITTIMNKANSFKTYHVSYFNSLKVYIKSLEDIESVGEIEYGVDIPSEYQSDVLKYLLNQENDIL